jgi:epoxyqueuosine reductase
VITSVPSEPSAARETAPARQAVAREEVATAGAQRHTPLGPGTERHDDLGAPEGRERLTTALLEAALQLGFSSIGVLRLERFETAAERLDAWLAEGRQGEMEYLVTGGDRAEPALLLPEARSALVVTLPHPAPPKGSVALRRSQSGEALTEAASATGELPRGFVAKYARGNDYHTVLKGLLLKLADECARLVGRPVVARACIDTAPLLEREAATRAGLGFIGKNTMAIVPGVGSYLMLGELLLDVELSERSALHQSARAGAADGCGKCTQCLTACPTGAFLGPYQLDARRCISYLTIEHGGPIPRELRPLMGNHVFGCDVCQDVCPFNQTAHKKPSAKDLAARPHLEAPDLIGVLELSSAGYRKFVRGTALKRAHRARLARNAAVALGNSGDVRVVPALVQALRAHPATLVRSHAAWALGHLAKHGERAVIRDALRAAAQADEEPSVREEAEFALSSVEARAAGDSVGFDPVSS